MSNNNLVLISGSSATGKSASLMDIQNPQGVMYLNCENNKKLPFRNKFQTFNITDPMDVYEAFLHAETDDSVHTIIIDTFTYLMDMYESVYVLPSANTMQAWGEYAQFAKVLFSQYVAKSTKNVIILAHTSDKVNESDQCMETLVQVKGSLMKTGIESFFSTVISSKKVPIKRLEKGGYESELLNLTEDDKLLGFKYVFQTKLTKETVNERMRSSMGMWSNKETFIDNNVQNVIERLHEYYGE